MYIFEIESGVVKGDLSKGKGVWDTNAHQQHKFRFYVVPIIIFYQGKVLMRQQKKNGN